MCVCVGSVALRTSLSRGGGKWVEFTHSGLRPPSRGCLFDTLCCQETRLDLPPLSRLSDLRTNHGFDIEHTVHTGDC